MENLRKYQIAVYEYGKEHEEKLRLVMSSFAKDFAKQVKGRKRWPLQTEEGVIVAPGDPKNPAIVLKEDGRLVYTQWGISVSPAEDESEVTGWRYFKMSNEMLDCLPGMVVTKNGSSENRKLPEGSNVGSVKTPAYILPVL